MELEAHPGYEQLIIQLTGLRAYLPELRRRHESADQLVAALVKLWGPILKSVQADDELWSFAYYELEQIRCDADPAVEHPPRRKPRLRRVCTRRRCAAASPAASA